MGVNIRNSYIEEVFPVSAVPSRVKYLHTNRWSSSCELRTHLKNLEGLLDERLNTDRSAGQYLQHQPDAATIPTQLNGEQCPKILTYAHPNK